MALQALSLHLVNKHSVKFSARFGLHITEMREKHCLLSIKLSVGMDVFHRLFLRVLDVDVRRIFMGLEQLLRKNRWNSRPPRLHMQAGTFRTGRERGSELNRVL